MKKTWFKPIFIFLMVFMLLFASPGGELYAKAADIPILTQEELAEKDFQQAKLLLYYYGLEPPGKEADKALNAQDLLLAYAKTDRWAKYYNPEEFAEYNLIHEGSMVGIGIRYDVRDGKVYVMDLIPNSPAARSDLKAGDIITKIDDIPLEGMTKEQIQLKFRGEEKTLITLEALSNGQTKTYIMIRTKIDIISVNYELLDSGMGYIQIAEFNNKTANQFNLALGALKAQKAKGLILDLRQCPGGTLNSAVDLSGAFTGEGPAVFVRQSGGKEYFLGTGNWPELGLPLAVLINENTASAAELVAANIQDAHGGVLIGNQTFGKGVMQTVFTLPSGAGVVFTTGQFFSRGYQNIKENNGVTPDIYIQDASAQVERAVQWLKLQNTAASRLLLTMNSKQMWAHGKLILLNQAPYIKDGSCYLPARQTLEALGCQVHIYDGILYLTRANQKIVLDIKNSAYLKNGLNYEVKAENKNGIIFLPASFYREAFNAGLSWDGKKASLGLTLP